MPEYPIEFAKYCLEKQRKSYRRNRDNESPLFQFPDVWKENPILFAEYMWQQPGAEMAVRMKFALRRANQRIPFGPGNVVWHTLAYKGIPRQVLYTQADFMIWKAEIELRS